MDVDQHVRASNQTNSDDPVKLITRRSSVQIRPPLQIEAQFRGPAMCGASARVRPRNRPVSNACQTNLPVCARTKARVRSCRCSPKLTSPESSARSTPATARSRPTLGTRFDSNSMSHNGR